MSMYIRVEYGLTAKGFPYKLTYRSGYQDFTVWHDQYLAPAYATVAGSRRRVEFGELPDWPRARTVALERGLFEAARRRAPGPVIDPEAALDRVIGRIRGYLSSGKATELADAVSLGEFTLAVLQRRRREAEERAARAPIPDMVEFDEPAPEPERGPE